MRLMVLRRRRRDQNDVASHRYYRAYRFLRYGTVLSMLLSLSVAVVCSQGLVVKHAPTFPPNLLTRRIVMVKRASAYTMRWKADMGPPLPERDVNNRRCTSSLAAGLVAFTLWTTIPAPTLAENLPGTAPGCASTTNPSGYTIVSCDRRGLDRNGRLLGCRCVPGASGASETSLERPAGG